MGYLTKLASEFRSSLENPQTPLSYPAEWLLDIFNGGRTDSGIRVSELTALQVTTVFTCVDIISSAIAAAPLNVYETLGNDSIRLAEDENLHFVLHDEPNEEMTSHTFRKTLQCHALLWGNLYAEIQRDYAGRPVALWPRTPNNTEPRRATAQFSFRDALGELHTIPQGYLFYATRDGQTAVDGQIKERYIESADMLHIPGLSLDGRLGRNVIELSRQAIGLALATEKFGGKFFANGLRPTGVVTLPNKMTALAVENFKRSMSEAYGGENMLRPMVIEEGMTWTEQRIAANEGQWTETREFQDAKIASLFRVPLRMVGVNKGGSNKGTAEQEGIEFVNFTLRPWIAPWEQELKRKLMPKKGRNSGRFYPGFDLEDLTLPDADSRAKFYTLLKQWGIANTDDIRKKLRWNPVGGKAGKTYWMPVNMQDASDPMGASSGGGATGGEPGGPPKLPPAPGAKEPTTEPPIPKAGGPEKKFWHLHPMFADAFQRYMRGEGTEARLTRAFLPVLLCIASAEADDARAIGCDPFDETTPEVALGCREYLKKMFNRATSWQNDEGAPLHEVGNAAEALRIVVRSKSQAEVTT